MRKVLLFTVIVLFAVGIAGSLAWRVWFQRRAASPVLMLRVSTTTEVTLLQGNPFIFTVYLSGEKPAPSLRIGSSGHPWQSRLKLESADPKQPLPWLVVTLASPQLSSFERAGSGELHPEKDAGDEAVVSSERLYTLELGVDPEEASRIPEGRYTARAILDIPFWPPWRWHGRIASQPVVITVVKQGTPGISTADLERQRLVESVEFYLEAQRFQEAYNMALQVKDREPETVYSYLLLGDALNGLKRDQEALDAYEYALYLRASEPQREPPEYLLMRKYEVERRLGLQQ